MKNICMCSPVYYLANKKDGWRQNDPARPLVISLYAKHQIVLCQMKHMPVAVSSFIVPLGMNSSTNNLPRWQDSWGQHWAHLWPTGPRLAPGWPHEFCYLSIFKKHEDTSILNAHWNPCMVRLRLHFQRCCEARLASSIRLIIPNLVQFHAIYLLSIHIFVLTRQLNTNAILNSK